MVEFRLKRGAVDYSSQSPHGSILDLAIEMDFLPVTLQLTNCMDHGRSDLPRATMHTLRRALLLGQSDYVGLLLSTQPRLLNEAKTCPWLSFGAAAAGKAESFERMIEILVRHGLSINVTDSRSCGSMLAAAS